MVVGVVEQEGIVPRVAVDLGVRDVTLVVQQGEDDLARPRRREAPVGREAGDQELRLGARQCRREVAAVGVGRVEIVERFGGDQVGIRVEETGKLVALVAQIGLDLEIDVVTELVLTVAQLPAELLAHLAIGQIGNVSDHSRQAQTVLGHDAMLGIVSAVEIRVRNDRLAGDFVERDILRRELRRRGGHDRMTNTVGKL